MKLKDINNYPVIMVPDHKNPSSRSRRKIDPRSLAKGLRRKADKKHTGRDVAKSSFIDWLGINDTVNKPAIHNSRINATRMRYY